ncbi:hypothetical protein [Halpernia sp. GG3]
MEKKIICTSCSSVLGIFENGKCTFKNMKALSQIEINIKTGEFNLKCHSCHNWNSIDKEGNIILNDKKKSEEVLFSSYQNPRK